MTTIYLTIRVQLSKCLKSQKQSITKTILAYVSIDKKDLSNSHKN